MNDLMKPPRNYRYRMIRKTIPRTGEIVYGVHEVYRDHEGRIWAWSMDSVVPTAETFSELAQELDRLVQALGEPVLAESIDDEGNRTLREVCGRT